MNKQLREEANFIISESIKAVLPDEAVKNAFKKYQKNRGKTILIAAGKAAWQMAATAVETLGSIDEGIVITKYGHIKGEIPGITCFEAGHPIPDQNTLKATQEAMRMVEGLSEQDEVIFLLSGGGSALFELPEIPLEELQDITKQLLDCGADIVEINIIRKRLSKVKGGRFAIACAPASVFAVVLSDIIGDPLDMIASGPAYPDKTTYDDVQNVINKYDLKFSENALEFLRRETPKSLDNVTTVVTGSVKQLCAAAANTCIKLGYDTKIITEQMNCEASEAGRYLSDQLRSKIRNKEKIALIAGGETVVYVKGNGMGGRNQELALAAAPGIDGVEGAAVFSIGSDGTDGPTDAAGGYVDSESMETLRSKGIDIHAMLDNNDAYNALFEIEGLIITGPTGTNVNDVAVALYSPR